LRYAKTTRAITVTVVPIFLEEQSIPDENRFIWVYQVRIDNESPRPVQLLNRYWHITDTLGRVTEVRGAGVVGEQPMLQPGESYDYTSGTPLSTPSGIMVGHYEMVDDLGDHFQIDIPAFSLDSPHQPIQLN
jgi:ApaG protein|tara:strand:- start:521 stop:916 length:396 start_codon:yes stop_codon:yes gene_type:complete